MKKLFYTGLFSAVLSFNNVHASNLISIHEDSTASKFMRIREFSASVQTSNAARISDLSTVYSNIFSIESFSTEVPKIEISPTVKARIKTEVERHQAFIEHDMLRDSLKSLELVYLDPSKFVQKNLK